MFKRYHVNPDTGVAGICAAKTQCRFQLSQEDHYGSVEEASKAYEKSQAEKGLTFITIKASREEKFKETVAKYNEMYPDDEDEHLEEYYDNDYDDFNYEEDDSEKEVDHSLSWLSEEDVAKIDVNGICCPFCQTTVTPLQAAVLLKSTEIVTCKNKKCRGKHFDLYDAQVEVGETKDTYQAMEKENIYKMTWYHSTSRANWQDKIENGEEFIVHLGSQQAAIDRQIPLLRKKNPSDYYIYEIKIDETAKIDDDIDEDENSFYAVNEKDGTYGEAKVKRYLNKWEDMASISLAAPTKKIKIIGKRKLTQEEAINSLSLYNVPEPEEY